MRHFPMQWDPKQHLSNHSFMITFHVYFHGLKRGAGGGIKVVGVGRVAEVLSTPVELLSVRWATPAHQKVAAVNHQQEQV